MGPQKVLKLLEHDVSRKFIAAHPPLLLICTGVRHDEREMMSSITSTYAMIGGDAEANVGGGKKEGRGDALSQVFTTIVVASLNEGFDALYIILTRRRETTSSRAGFPLHLASCTNCLLEFDANYWND
jgi:hypothetical protein